MGQLWSYGLNEIFKITCWVNQGENRKIEMQNEHYINVDRNLQLAACKAGKKRKFGAIFSD